MNKWQAVKLGDVCEIKYGKDHKKLANGEIPVYGSGGIMRFVDTSIHNKQSVLIPRKGTLSNLFFANPPFWTVDTIFWTNIFTDVVYPKYLYYNLLTNNLASYNVGTAVPSLTTSVLNEIKIPLPPLAEQRVIADTLSTLDDKIDYNNKINDYLAEIAASIFNLKFGKIIAGAEPLPDTWNIYTIGDLDVTVTDYVANGSFKSLSDNVNYIYQETDNVLIRLTDYNNNYNGDMVFIDDNAYEFLAKSKLYGDEVIISNVGANVGTVFRCPRLEKRMSLAPNAIMIKSKLFEHYLYMHFVSPYGQQQLLSIVTGSAQPKFNKTNFRSLEIAVPDKRTLAEFNTLYNPINEQICINANENARLSKLRDILLPKLMSGEISVAHI